MVRWLGWMLCPSLDLDSLFFFHHETKDGWLPWTCSTVSFVAWWFILLGNHAIPSLVTFLTEVLVLLHAGLRGYILPRDLAPLSGMVWCLARVGGRGPLHVVWFVPSSPKCELDLLPCSTGCHPLPCRLRRLAFPGLIDCVPGPAGSARLISRVL